MQLLVHPWYSFKGIFKFLIRYFFREKSHTYFSAIFVLSEADSFNADIFQKTQPWGTVPGKINVLLLGSLHIRRTGKATRKWQSLTSDFFFPVHIKAQREYEYKIR